MLISRARSLKGGILIIVMFSFGILSLTYGVLLSFVIKDYANSRLTERERSAELVRRGLVHNLEHLIELSINLSRPRDIHEAIEGMNNDVLSDWGKAFSKSVSSILFIDTDGTVIARAPDEFRFGDSVRSEPFFRGARDDGIFSGISILEGQEALVACYPVYMYNDTVVGYISIFKNITEDLLEGLLPEKNMRLSFLGTTSSTSPIKLSPSIENPILISVADGVFSLSFLPSPEYLRLLSLQGDLLSAFAVVTAGTILLLLFFLNRRFKPYTEIVDALVDYSENHVSLEELRRSISKTHLSSAGEICYISRALVKMIKVIEEKMRSIQSYSEKLEFLATRDSLTELWNRRKMDQILVAETNVVDRTAGDLSLIMVDIDFFKRVNDTFGHEVGDKVLLSVAATIVDSLRQSDEVGRWGGEEFLAVLPDTNVYEAFDCAERARKAVEGYFIDGDISVTASFGVTQYRPGEPINEFVSRADKALYLAKEQGRNMTCVSPS